VHVGPFPVDDSCPSEEEIAKEVVCLRPGRAPGASGMRSEHLKGWLEAATRKERPDRFAWDLLVTLVQHAYLGTTCLRDRRDPGSGRVDYHGLTS
jgi:hypothetical protein